ncbi:hypothetical protein [Nonomuraea sp. NPDC049400]|uniref:hypothetical protein n=1 Tax=Nonomuraea sp. NPDC049400 TaxID=3364352 RepID=UPI0037AE7D9B
MDFAYGQGSVFTGFTTTSDLDMVIIWGEDEPPPPERRPVELALEQQLPGYRDALLDCADRGDEWLFHQLA